MRRSHQVLATLLAIALSPLFSVMAKGQSRTSAGSNVPRTANGKPDLQGIWQVLTTAAWDIQDHAAQSGVPAGQGVVEGNEIPYQPWAAAKKKENYARRAQLDPDAKCYLSGVPRITYQPFPFQIFQTAEYVVITYEYNHTMRSIPLDGSKHYPAGSTRQVIFTAANCM